VLLVCAALVRSPCGRDSLAATLGVADLCLSAAGPSVTTSAGGIPAPSWMHEHGENSVARSVRSSSAMRPVVGFVDASTAGVCVLGVLTLYIDPRCGMNADAPVWGDAYPSSDRMLIRRHRRYQSAVSA
jgi:hypothetical protein